MALDDVRLRVIALLHDVGTRHDRLPAPVPEADPWDDGDALDPVPDEVSVYFPGVPSVLVRLYRDGQDVVVVEDVVDLDVPRDDVPAVVDSLLGGRARRRSRGGVVQIVLATLFHSGLASELVVPVGREGSARAYRASFAELTPAGRWLSELPLE
jgi:hypothetical protein